MTYVTAENITQRAVESFRDCQSPRLKQILEGLVRHLHALARETHLTPEEWRYGVDFLFRAGRISDAVRNEFMGLSDALGLSAVVELMADAQSDGTASNHLGPFYVDDAPLLEFNADLKGELPGDPVLLRGRVLDSRGKPVAGALINLWQTQADGLYDVQVPGLNAHRFRGWMRTRVDGSYQVRTIQPLGYTAPMDGPLGEMLICTSRNEWRPGHWHFLIRAQGYRTLVTELYPRDVAHLDDDMAFGARQELVVDIVKVENSAEAARCQMTMPFHKVEFDFRIVAI